MKQNKLILRRCDQDRFNCMGVSRGDFHLVEWVYFYL